MVEPTSLLLGLEGLAVSAVVRRADRTRVVEVITVDGRQTPPIGGAVRPNVYLDPERLLAGTAVAE